MICLCLTLRSLSNIYDSACIDNIFFFWIWLWIFPHFVRCCVHLPTYRHILESKSCYLSYIIVQRIQSTKLDSESFVNIYQFIRYFSVVFKKNSSVKDLIYPFCLSKCFGRNSHKYRLMWLIFIDVLDLSEA